MKRAIFLLALTWGSSSLAVDKQGQLDTETWTLAQSPYRLFGAVSVKPQATLTIEAGVRVEAATSGASLVVNGGLRVYGAPQQPVVFTSDLGPESWEGVRVVDGVGTFIEGAVFEKARVGLHLSGGLGATLKYVAAVRNRYGLYLFANTVAENLTVADNTLTGIFVWNGALNLRDSIVAGNSTGLEVMASTVNLNYNDVWGNTFIDYKGISTHRSVIGIYSFSENPMFVSANDYKLSAASPCIAAGQTADDLGAFPFGTVFVDGGTPTPDAGPNVSPDAGPSVTDAGSSTSDAGFIFDAGIDAGFSVNDAGVPDAGSSVPQDRDSLTSVQEGNDDLRVTASGCDCQQGAPGSLVLGLFAWVGVRRRWGNKGR